MEEDKVLLAKAVATFCHARQRYGDGEPYTLHLQNVVNVLKEFRYISTEYLIAGWLHDLVEDTDVSVAMIRDFFGAEVADLVYAVTNEIGNTRKERNIKTYYKLLNFPKGIPLKLSDRIANIRYSKEHSNHRFFEMYLKEYKLFKETLIKEGEHVALWKELDSLMNEGMK